MALQMAPLKPVALDPTQARMWQDTLGACSWIAPGFVHILYTMLANTDNGTTDVALFTEEIDSVAATDGFQLIFKPSLFFNPRYELLNRVFAVLHEVCHEMWDHCRASYVFRKRGTITVGGNELPWDDEYANFMQDFIINDTLVQSKFGKFHKDWLLDTTIASHNDDWVTAYFRNWKQRQQLPPPPPGNLPGQGRPGGLRLPAKGRFDQHLDPHRSQGKDPANAPPRQQAQWDVAVKTAMEIQRAQGKLPASMEHFFKQLLEPKVSWEDHIEGEFQRIMGMGAYDWRRLDRRLITRGIGAPGVTGKGARLIVVGGDTSMSVFANKALVARWLAEIGGMVENVNPEETHVVWCDTEVKRVDVCLDAQDIKDCMFRGVPGGGGTVFKPVFRYIEELDVEPDVLVYLTDGDGQFPDKEPGYPVIWGDISGAPSKYPWGKVVHIPTTHEEAA
jgi:predicted metal-dependent peptidase